MSGQSGIPLQRMRYNLIIWEIGESFILSAPVLEDGGYEWTATETTNEDESPRDIQELPQSDDFEYDAEDIRYFQLDHGPFQVSHPGVNNWWIFRLLISSKINGWTEIYSNNPHFPTHASIVVSGIDVGIVSGNLEDGIVLRLTLEDIAPGPGEVVIRFCFKNGNEIWIGIDGAGYTQQFKVLSV